MSVTFAVNLIEINEMSNQDGSCMTEQETQLHFHGKQS